MLAFALYNVLCFNWLVGVLVGYYFGVCVPLFALFVSTDSMCVARRFCLFCSDGRGGCSIVLMKQRQYSFDIGCGTVVMSIVPRRFIGIHADLRFGCINLCT